MTSLVYYDGSIFQITPEGFKKLASGCVNLQSLLLNDFPTLNDDCMAPITVKCTRLHTLSFLGSPLLSDETFRKLANNRNLRKLKVEGKISCYSWFLGAILGQVWRKRKKVETEMVICLLSNTQTHTHTHIQRERERERERESIAFIYSYFLLHKKGFS